MTPAGTPLFILKQQRDHHADEDYKYRPASLSGSHFSQSHAGMAIPRQSKNSGAYVLMVFMLVKSYPSCLLLSEIIVAEFSNKIKDYYLFFDKYIL